MHHRDPYSHIECVADVATYSWTTNYNMGCAVTKGGVINLTRQLAVDYSPLGVRVLAICPGYVSNWMGHSVGMGKIGDLPDVGARALAPEIAPEAAQARWEARAGAAQQQPLPRMCSPDEIASVNFTPHRGLQCLHTLRSAIASARQAYIVD